MTIYLYIKTHKITGLKYLGKTTQDPFKYLGSGKDWLPHLEKYGKDHYTEILMECQTKEEFKYWGRYYSRLWNIVNSQDDYGNKIWANQKIEGGDGGCSFRSPETRAKISAIASNRSLETRAKRSASMKAAHKANPRVLSPKTRAKISASSKGRTHTDEARAKISVAASLREALRRASV